MPLTDAGQNLVTQLLVGEAVASLNNANAHLGVGDSATAFAKAQTDLQGANKVRKAMEGGYPTRSTNVMTFRALFGTGEANFAWNEWGTFNGSSGGSMYTRLVESLGTKTAAQSWQLTVEVTNTN